MERADAAGLAHALEGLELAVSCDGLASVSRRFVTTPTRRRNQVYVMRTDALDRFGTPIERRFRRKEVHALLDAAGFADIRFSDAPPYWCVVGVKVG